MLSTGGGNLGATQAGKGRQGKRGPKVTAEAKASTAVAPTAARSASVESPCAGLTAAPLALLIADSPCPSWTANSCNRERGAPR